MAVLQWARENGCPWDEDTCSFAAEGGHLEVLAVGSCKWLSMECTELARGQQTEDIWKFCSGLVRMGVLGMRRTCSRAARGGHLDIAVGSQVVLGMSVANRTFGNTAVGSCEWLDEDLRKCSKRRPSGNIAVGSCKWLSLE